MNAEAPIRTPGQRIRFRYTNWRGEVADRHIEVLGVRFGSTEWHPSPQLLLRGLDLEKMEEREFAIADIFHDSVRADDEAVPGNQATPVYPK